MNLVTAWIYVVTEEHGCVAHVKVDENGRFWLSVCDDRLDNREVALLGPYHHKLVAIDRARIWRRPEAERPYHVSECE